MGGRVMFTSTKVDAALGIVTGVGLGAAVTTAIMQIATWGIVLGASVAVLGPLLIRARRIHNAKVLTTIQGILDAERLKLVEHLRIREEEFARESTDVRESESRKREEEERQRITALIEAWPLRRSVAIHHRYVPRVTKDGEVTMFLRATNYSPFAIALHSPQFTPYSGTSPATSTSTLPAQKRLDANGGTAELTVTGKFTSEIQPPLVRERGGNMIPRTHAEVFLDGKVTVERELDHAENKVGVVCESDGDWVKTVKIQ